MTSLFDIVKTDQNIEYSYSATTSIKQLNLNKGNVVLCTDDSNVSFGDKTDDNKKCVFNKNVLLTGQLLQNQIINFFQSGSIIMWTTNVAPNGWLLCNGQYYSRDTYPSLYDAIGNTFGNSGANFRVPNINSRYILGKSTINQTGGNNSLSISSNNIPNHNHTFTIGDNNNRAGNSNNSDYDIQNSGKTDNNTDGLTATTNSTQSHTHQCQQGGNHSHTVKMWTNRYDGDDENVSEVIRGHDTGRDNDNTILITINQHDARHGHDKSGGSHSHTFKVSDHRHNISLSRHNHTFVLSNHNHSITTPNQGSGTNLNIQQPYIILTYIIKI